MSFTITEAFVQQYGANFHILGQQMPSRLESTVRMEPGIVGQSKTVERLGSAEAQQINNRHADTSYVTVPHSRRWIDLTDYSWAELVDEMDKIKMLADPTSPYLTLGRAALNRKKDDVIIAAARGTARTGAAGASTVALPSAQKIAVGSSGLTIAKLLTAKQILDIAELDEEMGPTATGQMQTDRVCVVSAQQIANLLNTTEIKSADFNTVRALAQGQIDTFLGFKFIRTERVPKVSTSRFCLAYCRKAMALGIGMDIRTSIDTLPTKNLSVQVYARESLGAVRVEDAGVVEIACLES
jgi:hypothetical protein